MGVLLVGKVNFSGIHLECSAIIGPVDIFWSEVEMKMRKLVAVGSVVDFDGIKDFLHGSRNTCNVGHKIGQLGVAQFVKVVYVTVIGNETTAVISLFFE